MAQVFTLDDGVTTITFDDTFFYDRAQTPRRISISTHGRDWDRIHHDGCGPLEIYFDAIMLGTDTELRVAKLRAWRKAGTELTLLATGLPYYNGATPMTITKLVAPRVKNKLNDRLVSVEIVRMRI